MTDKELLEYVLLFFFVIFFCVTLIKGYEWAFFVTLFFGAALYHTHKENSKR